MHQVLRDLLGAEVAQKGSNLTQERLRFDFSYTPAISPEMVQQIEDEVNKRVQA